MCVTFLEFWKVWTFNSYIECKDFQIVIVHVNNHLLQTTIAINEDNISFRYCFKFLGRRSFDVSPVVTTTQEPTTPSKIWRTARSKIGSMDWSKLNKWRWNRRYINGWKCNLFVYDVLLESGAEAPNRWYSHFFFFFLVENKCFCLSSLQVWNSVYKCRHWMHSIIFLYWLTLSIDRMIGHNPIGANEWANPQSGFVLATGCYRNVPFENRIKGDIIAFRSNYGDIWA